MAGFDALPDWALAYHFTHHSPSGVSRPHCREFFEKAIARPANMYAPANCRMKAGIVCEQYSKDIVIDGEDANQAYRAAVAEFDQHKILEHDENDAARFVTIRDDVYEIPLTKEEKAAEVEPTSGSVLELTAKHTAAGLAEATAGANDITDGRQVNVYLEGVELPFEGEIDVEAGGVVEIKTKWPRDAKNERGWNVNSLPPRPDINHVNQVALYWKFLREQSENVPVKLVYANCKGWRVFDSASCDDLSEAALNDALDRLRIVARTRENLMKNASNIDELLSMVSPDFSHFMWRDVPPAYRELANQSWGL